MMVNEEEAVFTLGPDNDLKKVLANLNSGNHIINHNEGHCVDGSTFEEVDLAETINWYLEIVILLPLGIIGIFANLTSIPILLSRKMSSIFNQTLAVLAMVDTTYIILDTYRTVVRNLDPEENCFDVAAYLFLRPIQSIAMNASIFLTVVIAIERYLAVSRPLSVFMGEIGGHNKWQTLVFYVAPAIVLSILINIPCFFELEWVYQESEEMDSDNNTILVRDCSKLTTAEWRTHSHYVLFYINLTKNSLTGLIPLALLATMNFLVYRKLVNRRKEVEGITTSEPMENRLRIENRQVKTMFGVVILFILGHFLRVLLNVSELAHEIHKYEENAMDQNSEKKLNVNCASKLPFWQIVSVSVSYIMMTMSASGNLPIYVATNNVFRRLFCKKYVKCKSMQRSSNFNASANTTLTHISSNQLRRDSTKQQLIPLQTLSTRENIANQENGSIKPLIHNAK